MLTQSQRTSLSSQLVDSLSLSLCLFACLPMLSLSLPPSDPLSILQYWNDLKRRNEWEAGSINPSSVTFLRGDLEHVPISLSLC